MEVAVVSSKGESCSASVWNPFSGSLTASYLGGGDCRTGGLTAGHGLVIASQVNKPMLHAWTLNKQHKIQRRLIAPGKIDCVALSPDGNYIALSVDCKLYVYQTSSGILCGTGGNHFRPINIVRFNPEGTFIGCGGEDGLLTVWHMGDIVLLDASSKKPYLSLNAHSLPINDLVFTGGDLRSRVITVSSDRSLKIHDVRTKDKLFGGHFENQLSALALCTRESALYLGDTNGNISQISLLSPPRKVNVHYSSSNPELAMIKFHEGRINCLSVSLDCTQLLSGSNDCTVKLIHIESRQCLRTINFKGAVTNCFFYIIPSNCFSVDFEPSIHLHDFITRESVQEFSFEIFTTSDIASDFTIDDEDNIDTTSRLVKSPEDSQDIENLKRINNDLYSFAVNKLFKGLHSHQQTDSLSDADDNKSSRSKSKVKKK